MPEEWKGALTFLLLAGTLPRRKKARFTEYGYIVESGDEWERQFEGREVPEEYRIMELPAAGARRTGQSLYGRSRNAASRRTGRRAQQPRPVVPIILTSEKPAEKVKEITARLEQGVQAIFDSDRYKEF